MFRTTDIVLIAVMISAAAFTYKTKHEAENTLDTVRNLEEKVSIETDTIDVLKADWSLLTQPNRLQKLVEIYQNELELEPVGAEQIVNADELPARPVDIQPFATKRLGGMAEGGKIDNTTTGGIVQ